MPTSKTAKGGAGSVSTLQQKLDEAKGKAAQAQNDLNDSNQAAAGLQRMVDELSKSGDAAGKARVAFVKEIDDAVEQAAALAPIVKNQLSDDAENNIKQVVSEVNEEIKQFQKNLDDAQTNADAASNAAQVAGVDVASARASFDSALNAVKSFPTDLNAAKDKVARLKTALKTASAAGKWNEAYYQGLELESALNDAAALSGAMPVPPAPPEEGSAEPAQVSYMPKSLAERAETLQTAWDALLQANTTANQATKDLTVAQTTLASAQQALTAAQKGRDENIRKQLDPLPKATPA